MRLCSHAALETTQARDRRLAMDQLFRIRRLRMTQRERRLEQRQWTAARRAEEFYRRVLRQVAAQIGQLVQGVFNPDDPQDPGWQRIIDALNYHSYLIRDWAAAAAQRMIAEVDRRDMAVWYQHGKQIGRALRAELAAAPIGPAYDALLQYQIDQITGISASSAERIARLRDRARGMTYTGERWSSIVDAVQEQEGVARSHAETIARTETSRAQSTLTSVRAQHIGSEYFQWVTTGDADVRPLHRHIGATNGGVYRWDDPPILDDGRPGLPGTIYNCFTGDTLVDPLGRYLRAFRARYRGPLIILRVADTFVRVTPNHPILTTTGWRSAGSLQEGDYVFQACGQDGKVLEADVDHRLLTFEQIFEAGTPDVEPLATYDFYGDAVEDKVEVVRPKHNLPLDQETARFQDIGSDNCGLWQLQPIVRRTTRWFSGYVYTLETEHGYYGTTSARIISKNCRCWARPILPEESTDLAEPTQSPEYTASLRPEAAPINAAYREGRLTYGQYVDRLLALGT